MSDLPAETRCTNDTSSQTLVNRIVSYSDSKSWMFSANCFQILVLERTKSFTSCDFALVNTPLVAESSFPGGFSRVFSFFVKQNCHTNSKLLRKHWADLQNEWFGTRSLCLKHPYWSVWSLFSTNEYTLSIRYFLPSKFQQNFLLISFKKYQKIFNVCQGFRRFVSWMTYPYVWTFWLWNFEQSGSVLHFYLSVRGYCISCFSVVIW